jgi:polar amino acid transport system substrate-binding protein
MSRIAAAALAAALVATSAPLSANDLLPTGTLRATYIASNTAQAFVDPQTNEVRGAAAEIARDLAKKLGVPYTIKGVTGVSGVLASVKAGEADIGFVAYDPVRAAEVDFSQTYALAQNTYVVLDGSPIKSAADVDKAGVRVGVATNDAGDLFLTRNLKSAEIKRNQGGNLDVAVKLLQAGEIDVYAANRTRLSELIKRVPGLRLTPENFYGVEQAVSVQKGNARLLAVVEAFLDEARTSGLIQGAIERAGVPGVDVAPKQTR